MLALILRHTRRPPQVVASPAALSADSPGAAGKARPSSRPPTVTEQLDASAIDLQGALTRCGGQEALLRKLITRFCQEQADVAARCQAMRHSDPQQARRVAHMLKGTAGNLGMSALSRHAAELEDALAAANPELVDASLQSLGTSMQQHHAALQAWLGEAVAA